MSAQYVHRASVRFSADGRRAACLAFGSYPDAHLEGWELTGQGPRRWLRMPIPPDAGLSYALPVSGGGLLLTTWRHERQHLALVGPDGMRGCRPVPQLRVTAAPPGPGLALGLVDTPAGATAVFRIDADVDGVGEGWRSLVAEAPEPLRGPGVVAGDRVVFHVRRDGAAVPVVLDPTTGEVTPLELPAGVRGAIPIHAAGDTVLVGVSVAGRHRLATLSLRDPARLEPLGGLDHLDGAVQPLALDPTGAEVVLRLRRGARSRLLRHRLATRRTREITAPPGTASPPAAWTDAGLWLPFVTTTTPVALWWLPGGGAKLRPALGAGAAGRRPGRVETLPGPAGPVEAVRYGDWRRADRVVLALHGGPAERWSLTFDPGLQALASAGLAVVAPNPRGSTGYGRGYQEAIKGAWGGPDLADVVAVGSHLVRERGRHRPLPALFGVSYGAFLGLLAVAEAPELWSGCVAVAPFLSGARLYPEATAPVRALLDRLGGTAMVAGAPGPRDLLRLAPRMRGRVFVVHGERDPTIPVSHSRALVAALAGRPEVSVTYRELAGRGHQPFRQSLDSPEFVEIIRFLGGTVPKAAPPTESTIVDR